MQDLLCSQNIKTYFNKITSKVKKIHTLANEARKKGFDPEDKVDIPLAASVAQRVEGLVSSEAPDLLGSGLAQRITEFEKKYSAGDWRIALLIAEEVAKEKFGKFSNRKKAIEIGIRTGLAYITLGVVSAPLEGFVEIKFKKRKDGKEYIAIYYAGPIRSAGGTAAAVSIIIADYLAKIAHRQYKPTTEELELLIKNIKVELNGDPTERYEVSQCKRMERVETDRIRGGMALVITEGPTLKAEKLWKKLSKWKDDFGLDDWDWLKEFIVLKKKIHSGQGETKHEDTPKVTPVDSYLTDMVAGRPVFGYPLRSGAFRLRYGRARTTGFASTGIHPVSMQILNGYVATGTQLKMERPGKATVV
ncbi:DNA polymerase II large subunit, partial [Candidatus Woesearchaeota archaeon]|nr:DNA polymerase II large subunit [Candidatus Woesearchaeota archaeon]